MSLSPAIHNNRIKFDVFTPTRKWVDGTCFGRSNKRIKRRNRFTPFSKSFSSNTVSVFLSGQSATICFWKKVGVEILDCFGNTKTLQTDCTVKWHKNLICFYRVVNLSCISVCTKIIRDCIGFVVLPCNGSFVVIGTPSSLHCVGCGKPFHSVKEACDHFNLPLIKALVRTAHNKFEQFWEPKIHPEFQKFLKTGNYKFLPSVDPTELNNKLKKLVEANS